MVSHDANPDETAAKRESRFFRVVGVIVRFVMLAPVLATFAIAVALLAYGVLQTWQLIEGMIRGPVESRDDLLLHALEIVDVFLVALVILVASIGIYQLFINRRIPVPKWLRIYDIDDLKARLIGVVITVLGVHFLSRVLAWDYGEDILPLGLSVAAVVLVLTYFLSVHFRRESDLDDPE
jgi:uncharacterized membrane protein YqhA